MPSRDPQPSRPVSDQSGFVLADAITALFILASVSVSLVSALVLASRQGQTAEASAAALVLAQRCMNETTPDMGSEVRREGGQEFVVRRVRTGPDDEDIRRLLERRVCAVSWNEAGGTAREVKLERVDVIGAR